MRYWAFLAAKFIAGGLLAGGIAWILARSLPEPDTFMSVHVQPFAGDLIYTFALILYGLFCVGLVYAIIWDQRYRCRTCLRRLRMPIATGSWKNVLLGPPRTEYICVYGHGTLKFSELQITGRQQPDWQKHDDDIWKELFPVEETKN